MEVRMMITVWEDHTVTIIYKEHFFKNILFDQECHYYSIVSPLYSFSQFTDNEDNGWGTNMEEFTWGDTSDHLNTW